MKVKKCINCKKLNHENDKFCVYCGTPLIGEAIEEQLLEISTENKHNTTKKTNKKSWRFVKIGLILIFLVLSFILQSRFALIIAMIPSLSLLNEYNKQSLLNKKTSSKPIRSITPYILFLVFFIFAFSNLSNQEDTAIPVEETEQETTYQYDVEAGYEYIEPISVDDMTMRVTTQIEKLTTDYEYLTVEEMDDQFIINFDITSIDNIKDAAALFKSIVNNLTISKANYLYIKDLNAHFYYKGEYLYTARLYNLFLIDVISLDQDGTFYDSQSNVSILFKTLKDPEFTFPNETIDYDGELPDSTNQYLMDYDTWYGDFDLFMSTIYDDYDAITNQYIEEGIEPTLETIRQLDYQTQQLSHRCDTFDEIKVDYYYEAFHQYFSRGCRFYLKGYEETLEGLENKSIDRIEYAYLDFNLGYYYFDMLFENEEVEISEV